MRLKILILLIILFGILVRVLWLGSVPSGFFRDESALGYNSYSIWHTGKDEFGIRLPLFFRSFEVFFLPLYVYLSAPIVGALGLTEFSTRFLSSLAGIIALFVCFLITKRISGSVKTAAFATAILAVSPWHIFYSRGAFEGNLALTLFAAGFLFLLYFFGKEQQKFLVLSVLFFVFSMYSYQAERVVVPLLGIAVLLLNFRKILNLKQKIIFPAFAAFLLLIPILTFTSKAAGIHRAAGVSIFQKSPEGWVEGRESGFFVNNETYLRTRQVIALYLSYFSPRNLLFEGDYDKQRSVENSSVFYAWILPLMFIGFRKIINQNNLEAKLLIAWIFLAPLPAALTGDPFHTYRSLLLYFPLTIISGIGLNELYDKFLRKKEFLIAVSAVMISGFSYFLYNYAVITPVTRARNWDFGYKELISYLTNLPEGKIVIHDPTTEAYIHYLFFAKKDPLVYQNAVAGMEKPEGYYYNDSSEIRPTVLEKFEFRGVDWPSERGETGTTFAFSAKDLPESEFKLDPRVELLKEIKYPDGEPAYRIVLIK